jgi:RIO-like serine/threonine protein kinase
MMQLESNVSSFHKNKISNEKHSFIKMNVSMKEYLFYKHLDSQNYNFIPKIYEYDKNEKILTTQKINGSSISDFYGEDFILVPKSVICKIRKIVRTLYEIGIAYPDITGYNFIQDNKKHIWVIDFEHCFVIHTFSTLEKRIINNEFIKNDCEENEENEKKEEDTEYLKAHIEFIELFCYHNKKSWNPDFM